MHDDQHIARLFLLDEGIRQGILYPRWVDTLGFGYGYPLFNFYPPLIYYVSEFFVLLGFTYITSIKLMLVTGFVFGAIGMFLFVRRLANVPAGFVAAVAYTYFSYHAVLVYVRGAFAEFFAVSVLPFVFWRFYELYKKNSRKNIIYFAITLALIVLAHPLIAFPTILYLGIFYLYYLWQTKDRLEFTKNTVISGMLGLGLSAFYWIPSLFERTYTLTDSILLKELARYDIHFVYLQQLWHSNWGFGGSVEGLSDGVSFQLGKIFIGLVVVSFISFFALRRRNTSDKLMKDRPYLLFVFLLILSLFMSLTYSSFIWDSISYLGYLQFPWRFLSFANIFIPIVIGYSIYFIGKNKMLGNNSKKIAKGFAVVIVFTFLLINTKYFAPQEYVETTDKERTTFEEIAWRISRSSFEFIPKDVSTTQSEEGTTIPNIQQYSLPEQSYEVIDGQINVSKVTDTFYKKSFRVDAKTPTTFRLNTFYFPGWIAMIDDTEVSIESENERQLITIQVPEGQHTLEFKFKKTTTRTVANTITLLSILGIIGFMTRRSKIQKLL